MLTYAYDHLQYCTAQIRKSSTQKYCPYQFIFVIFSLAGIGALLVRKDAEKYLSEKRYFGGGTANGYLAQADYYNPRKVLHER